MDKLKSLMIFLQSAQHQSFSQAARQLSMSPSAVSRAVARLEDVLGLRLLQRTTRSLTLTEDGTKYYQRCQQILDELEAAISGAGIIQAPKYIVARAIQQRQLQPILANYASQEKTMIAIIYPQKNI